MALDLVLKPWLARSLCAFAAAAPLAAPAWANAPEPRHVDAALVADTAAAGDSVWVGLRLRHQAQWHTYWKNPGDAGMPTRIEWDLPAGWSAGGINWPAPARIQVGPLGSYGYEGDVVLPVRLFAPANWDRKTPVKIAARANWLACKEQCIPESGSLAVSLPAKAAPAEQKLLAEWRARVPQPFRFKTAGMQAVSGRLVLVLEPAGAGEFFPEREELVEPGDKPQVSVTGTRATWSAKLGPQGKGLKGPAALSGVWVPAQGAPLLVTAKFN
jgi:thiol:disulfide interchange protein DsbD